RRDSRAETIGREQEQQRFKRGTTILPRFERMTIDDTVSSSSRRMSTDSTGSSLDEMENGEDAMTNESPRLLQMLDFTPDSLNFVGKKVTSRGRDKYIQIGRQYDLSFKMVRSESRLVKTLLYSYGFTQVSARNPNFNLVWTSTHLKAACLRSLKSWQRVNHFPRSGELTRKDRLYENISRSKAIFGASPGGPFSFIPEFYVTPRDMDRLTKAMEDRRSRPSGSGSTAAAYIVKPVMGSRGRGIFFANKPDDIPLCSPLLVSRYLSSPLTVNEHKFDLRVYVAVTSFYPLVAYVYTEGLTRLASEKYSRSAKEDDEFVHLTNYSVNKNSKNFVRNETLHSEDYGHKWTLGALLRNLEERNIDSRLLMLRIEDLITKSLLSVQSTVSAACRSTVMHPSVLFELFGFDILVDDHLKPWLLEVNLSPSLTCDAPLDSLVKTKLICDLFNLTGVQLISKKTINAINGIAKGEKEGDWDRKDNSSSGVSSSSPSTGPRTKRILTRRVDSKIAPVKRKWASVRAFTRKIEMEDGRRGDFLRIFPRENSMSIYGPLMEDVGSEKWDARVTEVLFPDEKAVETDLVARLHNELIDTKTYPSFSDLSPEVASLLQSSYSAAGEYAERITKEGEVYRDSLPSVRSSARQRTKSCAEWYELRMNEKTENEITDGKVQVQEGKENTLPLLSSSSLSRLPSTLTNLPPLKDDAALKEAVEKMTSVQ
ncbi:hypothetical protein PFISCL1PPCAC_793, partial [Pristionchus fissidentatus]